MNRLLRGVLMIPVGLILSGTAGAEETAVFSHAFSAGLSMARGNSQTVLTNAAWRTEGERDRFGALRLGVEGAYGKSTVDDESETTAQNARAFANAQKTISARTFGSLDTVLLFDDVARIDYRIAVSPGLGFYWFRSPRAMLLTEAGPAYIWEEVDAVRDDFLALRLAERARFALSETAKVWQSLEYLPKADDLNDYLLNAELGLEAAINSKLSLWITLQNTYDSTPGEDLKKYDFSLITGLRLSL